MRVRIKINMSNENLTGLSIYLNGDLINDFGIYLRHFQLVFFLKQLNPEIILIEKSAATKELLSRLKDFDKKIQILPLQKRTSHNNIDGKKGG